MAHGALPSSRCTGFKLAPSTPHLGCLVESVGNWFAAGMPWATTERNKRLLGASAFHIMQTLIRSMANGQVDLFFWCAGEGASLI